MDISERHLAEYIQDRIKTLDVSQNEFARMAGISTATLSEVLAGKVGPGVTFFKQVSAVVGVSPGTLLDLYLKKDHH